MIRKFMAGLEAAGQAPEGAGGGGDLDLGGDEGGGDELDLGGGDELDLGGDEGAAEEPAAEDDSALLAAPGKRDDDKSRGPYKKHQLKYRKGGFSKHMKNQATGEFGNTTRSIFKGKTGFGGLDSLARGVTENKTLDKIEEEKLFKTSTEIKKLLEGLNKSENTENESKTQ